MPVLLFRYQAISGSQVDCCPWLIQVGLRVRREWRVQPNIPPPLKGPDVDYVQYNSHNIPEALTGRIKPTGGGFLLNYSPLTQELAVKKVE